MDLFISSGPHTFTNHEKRISRCETALDSPDVMFVETSIRKIDLKNHIVLFVFAPLLVGANFLWESIILRLATSFFGDDTKIDRYFENEYDASIIPVDIPHTTYIYDNRRLWAILNWSIIIWSGSIFPWLSKSHVVFLIIQALILLLGYVAAAQPFRNRHIADQIASYSDEFTNGCFITGSAHHEPVAKMLQDNEDVDVLNPDRSG